MTTLGERLQAECQSQLVSCLTALEATGATPGIATVLVGNDLRLLVQLTFSGDDEDAIETTTDEVFHCLGHALAGAETLVFTVDVTAARYPRGSRSPRPRDDPEATNAFLTMAIQYMAGTRQLAVRQFLLPYRVEDDGSIDPEPIMVIDEDAWLAPRLLAAVAAGASWGPVPLLEVADSLDTAGQTVWLPESFGPTMN